MIELQRKLMGDTVRNTAFADALKRAVKPGDTVIDLGSGTGFLSFLASRLGAKEVILIESGEILEISKKLAIRNGIKNCRFIRMHSTEIKSLPKADVLVSETLGNYALEENIIESVEDGKRFLKPGGIIIPGKVTQYVCPVVSDRLKKDIDVWPDVGFDLAFDEAREVSLHNMYVKTLKPADLLQGKDAIVAWDNVDFAKKNKSVRTAKIVWKPGETTIHGLALWWDSELIPGVTLSTAPDAPLTHWEQIYLPLSESLSAKKGSTVELTLKSDTRYEVKINLEWRVKLLDPSGKVLSDQSFDMMKGYLN